MQRIYLTLLSTSCVEIHKICEFLHKKPQFIIELLCIFFLSQTLYTFKKSSPSKCKFSDIAQRVLNFTKLFMSFFKKTSVFLQTLDHSSVSWEITLLYIFSWDFICYWQNEPIKVQDFRLLTAHLKTNQIPYVIFQTTSQFIFRYCIILHCHDT